MNKLNNKSGFTLIEIIVVLIIIGILAAIALPNLFSNVTKSKGSTAIAAMDGIKTELEAYATQNNIPPNNGEISTLGLPTNNTNPTNGFYFTISTSSGTPASNDLTYTIAATDASNNEITLERLTTGTFTCSAGTGAYQNDC